MTVWTGTYATTGTAYYLATCSCGWRGVRHSNREAAERQLNTHQTVYCCPESVTPVTKGTRK